MGQLALSAPFDSVASGYDAAFSSTGLGRLLRERTRSRLASIPAGARVLELGCGTGEDAIWLAARGVHVLATDRSPRMLEVARRKSAESELFGSIEFACLDLARPGLQLQEPFHMVWSNFGAFNCVQDLRPFAEWVAPQVRTGGQVALVIMGSFCPWEVGLHIARGQWSRAFRRLGPGAPTARVGDTKVPVYYPSPRAVARAFTPHFQLIRVEAIGVLLPPPYLSALAARHLRMIRVLDWAESRLAAIFPFNRFGDHYLIEFEKKAH